MLHQKYIKKWIIKQRGSLHLSVNVSNSIPSFFYDFVLFQSWINVLHLFLVLLATCVRLVWTEIYR